MGTGKKGYKGYPGIQYPRLRADSNTSILASLTGRKNISSSAETSASSYSTSNANVTAAMENYILRECFMLISTHGAQILNFSIIREEEGMRT